MIQRLLYCQRRGRSLHLQQKTIEIVQTITGAAPLARVQRNSFKRRVPNKNMYDALTYSSNLMALGPNGFKPSGPTSEKIVFKQDCKNHTTPTARRTQHPTPGGRDMEDKMGDKPKEQTGRQAGRQDRKTNCREFWRTIASRHKRKLFKICRNGTCCHC